MAEVSKDRETGDVWFAYDGNCPICTLAAQSLQIRQNVGQLHLVNAREERTHPLIQEVNSRGLDLDKGMVLKYGGTCYHGEGALHMMALLGSPVGWFNRANAVIFKSKLLSKLCYPLMRGTRTLLLRVMGVGKLKNLERHASADRPIFQDVFGKDWDRLPKVMRDHYAVRPYSEDTVTVKGELDIEVSRFMAAMSRISGMLISRSGKNVPVTVQFRSGADGRDFIFDRVFHYPEGDQRFLSRMVPVGGNELVEFMRYGVGWKTAYSWDGEKVRLDHRGYVWRLFGLHVPVPLGLMIGEGEAEETPVSDQEFSMWTHARQRWFGTCFAYAGSFKIVDVQCGQAS